MVFKKTLNRNFLLILLLLVLTANFSLYHTSLDVQLLPEKPNLLVVASMIDLALISPILYLTWIRKMNWKNLIFGAASGLILVSFLIPVQYLSPFKAVTWLGFTVESGLLILEFFFLISLFKYLPTIVYSVKKSPLPVLFSFSREVEKLVKPYPIIRIISSELLMFYYAFASWRKKPHHGANMFTLHQKSSVIALKVLLIHATILEMTGIHWLIYGKSVILSIILLVINIYTVIFFVGDIQAIRFNPLFVTDQRMHLSFGLLQRIEIQWSNIKEVIDAPQQLKQKRLKGTIDFIARDFEEVHPDFIIKLKHPVEATLIMGIKKEYFQVAIRLDEPSRFKELLKTKL